ncbi:MAG TPA: MFS transporter [Allosphingosinicella sp.]|nr:MFS transporter [Allosphingosinicella sp.]
MHKDTQSAPISPEDVTPLIRGRPMHRLQVTVVMLCVAMNIIDGFDVLSMAFVGPTLSREWGLPPDQLGLLFSAGLAGMGAGALFLSPLADAIGRRPTILICLLMVGCGMLASAFVANATQLMATRAFTGLGIGAMLSTNIALVTEYVSAKRFGLAMGLMAVGFPLGATLGGAAAAALIGSQGWSSVFLLGGGATLAMIPLVFFLMPESIDYLAAKRSPRAFDRADRLLARLGLPPLDRESRAAGAARGGRLRALVEQPYRGRALRLGAMFLLVMLSFYFIVNWAPKLAVEAGQPPEAGVLMGTLLNLAGAVGAVVSGLLVRRFGLRRVTATAIALMGVGIVLFGFAAGRPALLVPVALGLGFMMYATMMGIYPLTTTSFPASVRVTAVGLISTAGRIGSVLGPLLTGLLLAQGLGIVTIGLLLALPALAAAAILLGLDHRDQ